MAFDSFNAFIAMDGHGPYVWTCYAAFFGLIGLLVWWSVTERRRVYRNLRFQLQLSSSKQYRTGTREPTGEAGFRRIQSSQSESVSKS